MFKIKISLIVLLFSLSILSAQDATSLLKTGFDKIKTNDFVGAEQDFTTAIRLNETAVSSYLEKMKKYSTLNAFEKATSDMPDGFVYNNAYAIPYYGRGLAMEGQGKQDAAYADYEKAVLIDPKNADALCQYALALIFKGQKDQACVNLQKAKSLGSEKAMNEYAQNDCKSMGAAFLKSGTLKLENKDYAGAIEDFTNGIKLNSEMDELFIKRAECYRLTKLFDKAVNDYSKALKANPDSSKILLLRGATFNEMHSFQLAFEDLTRVIKLNPNIYEAYMERGIACEGLQNFSSAEYDYSHAIRIKPKECLPYYKRGIATQDNKNNKSCKDFKIAASLGCEDAKNLAEGCEQ